jgi:hypothetical protein
MTEAWRIDSLDARAGMAFGSWRPADLASARGVDLASSAVFLAPPYFRAEALNDRTVGFSASRSLAQFGVFIGRDELAFATLDEMSAFVRRVYQSSGGGDLPGGGATGGPPGFGPEGGPEGGPEIGKIDFPTGDLPMKGLGGAQAFVQAATSIKELAGELKFEPGKPTPTRNAKTAGSNYLSLPVDATTLTLGAQELLIELVRRFPLRGRHADIVKWSDSGNRLGEAIGQLNLWPKIFESAAGPALDQAAMQISKQLPASFHDRWLIRLLMQKSYSFVTAGYGSLDDPLDNLSAWPLPYDVRSLVGSHEKDPSAYHLLAAVLGSPQKLVSNADRSASLRAASIILFSAAHIIGETTPQSVVAFADAGLVDEAIWVATRNTWDWLVPQLPANIFPTEVETIIGASAALAAA